MEAYVVQFSLSFEETIDRDIKHIVKNDCVARLSTGYGKSLIFKLASLVLNTCFSISP